MTWNGRIQDAFWSRVSEKDLVKDLGEEGVMGKIQVSTMTPRFLG